MSTVRRRHQRGGFFCVVLQRFSDVQPGCDVATTSPRRGCTSLKRRQDVGRTSTGRCQDVATTSPRHSDIKRDRQTERQTDRQTHGHSLSLIVSDTPANCRVYLQRLTDSKTLLFAVVYNSLQCEWFLYLSDCVIEPSSCHITWLTELVYAIDVKKRSN